jgi:hypothetical protein
MRVVERRGIGTRRARNERNERKARKGVAGGGWGIGLVVAAMGPFGYGAKWEVRFVPNNCFRTIYRIDNDNLEVFILAIGEKRGD